MSRVPAEKRLERLMVMVPWVMAEDGPEVEKVCRRYDITEAELTKDLELLFMCGLYPFTPDTLIEADIVDGRVFIRSADQFQRPPTFSAEEALALMTAASAAAELQGNEENQTLKAALAKLSNALGLDSDDAVAVALSPSTPALDDLRTAIDKGLVVELDYYSYGRDAWSRRQVAPYQLFNSEGHWYLQGEAREARETRNFRVDRMRNIEVTTQPFDLPAHLPEQRSYQARESDPVVVMDLDQQGRWVREQYPLEAAEERADGNLRITMRVSERLWLQRLLLRLGNHAHVIEGNIDVAASANQILQRYQRQAPE